MQITAMTRRTFLKKAALAGAATALPGILTGCGSSSGATAETTLQNKIGQMLMIGFTGTETHPSDTIIRDISEHGIGGIILFERNISPDTVTSSTRLQALNKQLQSYARLPLYIALDQEGGRVARLNESSGYPHTVSARYLGGINDPAITSMHAESIASTLANNGVNMNLAPVVDLDINPDSPAIGRMERSFSADPAIAVNHARIFVEAHNKYRVLTCLKHFPGHGSATEDSHLGFADVSGTWSEIELEPFNVMISEGKCHMVMTAHLFNKYLDTYYPATLSYLTITGILRQKLGYNGVVITDDMQMGAIVNQYGFETAIEKTIMAGADIIMFANALSYDPEVTPKTINLVCRLVENGFIPVERINESYSRILAMKQALKEM